MFFSSDIVIKLFLLKSFEKNMVVFNKPILCKIYIFSSFDKSLLNIFLDEYDLYVVSFLSNLLMNSST